MTSKVYRTGYETCSSSDRNVLLESIYAKALRTECATGEPKCIENFIKKYENFPISALQQTCSNDHPCNKKDASSPDLIEAIVGDNLRSQNFNDGVFDSYTYRQTLAKLVDVIQPEYGRTALLEICRSNKKLNGIVNPDTFRAAFPKKSFYNQTRSGIHNAFSFFGKRQSIRKNIPTQKHSVAEAAWIKHKTSPRESSVIKEASEVVPTPEPQRPPLIRQSYQPDLTQAKTKRSGFSRFYNYLRGNVGGRRNTSRLPSTASIKSMMRSVQRMKRSRRRGKRF